MRHHFGEPDRWLIAKGAVSEGWDIFPPERIGDIGEPVASYRTGAEAIAAFARGDR